MRKSHTATLPDFLKVSDKHSALIISSFYSNGKLLLTGEYTVLEGALSLAVPTVSGQHLSISEGPEGLLHWQASQPSGTWFECTLQIHDLRIIQSSSEAIAERLVSILSAARQLQPGFLDELQGYRVKTELTFDRNWGLGSSSTLISALARWAGINPYRLLGMVSGGSGYDIACATAKGPICYQLVHGKPTVNEVEFRPDFNNFLYFVYLGKKQDSETAVKAYLQQAKDRPGTLTEEISDLTRRMVSAGDATTFREVMKEHETLMSQALGQPTINETLFKGFPGTFKSLGAWGGDFALLCSRTNERETAQQLSNYGFDTWFRYQDMVLQTT